MTPEEIATLAKVAQLSLDEARLSEVGEALSAMLSELARLDEVDLGEIPPTNAFDARWRFKT